MVIIRQSISKIYDGIHFFIISVKLFVEFFVFLDGIFDSFYSGLRGGNGDRGKEFKDMLKETMSLSIKNGDKEQKRGHER